MFEKNQIVLVDTNVVIEAHRVRCWIPLAQYFCLHTVEKVIEETQNGFQNRSPDETIDEKTLRGQFKHIEDISELDRADFKLRYPLVELDPGERDLVIYAGRLNPKDVWFLNSPDCATVKHAGLREWRDRLISLEEMIKHLNIRTKKNVENNYTANWLSNCKRDFLMNLRF